RRQARGIGEILGQYLSDTARLSAFRAAIQEVVKPGNIVVDLGAGTGVLGLLACRAGAKRVFSIESTGIIQLTREISQANGFRDRTVFLNESSTRCSLPSGQTSSLPTRS